MHFTHHDTALKQQKASENSRTSTGHHLAEKALMSTQLLTQDPPRHNLGSKQGSAILLVARIFALPAIISITLLGLAVIYSGGCIDAQAGEGNTFRVIGKESVCD